MSGSECSSSGRQFPQNETDADIEDFFFIESPIDPLSMDYDNAEEGEEVEENGINEEVRVEIINHNDIVEAENETEEKPVVDRRKESPKEVENGDGGHHTEQKHKLVHLLQPPLHYYPPPPAQYYVPFLLPYPHIPVRNNCYPYCSYIM